MDIPSTPSPGPAHALRRRKKRNTPTNGVPGSALNGLNRSSIRVVELVRGSGGYGFTISGQKPCLLRCIVEGSPAERANLRPGNCLVGVNNKDVSHLAHDEVVRLIGSCTGLLRLHVADSYFSESSEDEGLQGHQSRPKYPHRPRALSKGAIGKKISSNGKLDGVSVDKSCHGSYRSAESAGSPTSRYSSWDQLVPAPRRVPRSPVMFNSERMVTPLRKPRTILGSKNSHMNGNNHDLDMIRVFPNMDGDFDSASNIGLHDCASSVGSSDRFNSQNGTGSSGRSHNHTGLRKGSPCTRSTNSLGLECLDQAVTAYQAVVGYIGSVELPEIEEKRRLQALTACVRRLRMEKRVRSIVLLKIESNGVSLFGSSQNVQNAPPLAFYSSSIIAFCGACSDDRRFFGLVTCNGHNSNSSCHVFMVEPKLISHQEHLRRARAFGIQCSPLQVPRNGQVLGLQECAEFPATADSILNSILRLHRSAEDSQQRSPSEASNRLESTNSSNSDSGIGFRDDSDRTSARIYDIVEDELSLSHELRHARRSPIPRKRFPVSHRKSLPGSGHCSKSQQFLNGCSGSSTSKQNIHTIKSSRSRDSGAVSNPSCFLTENFDGGYPTFESNSNSLRNALDIRRDLSEAGSSGFTCTRSPRKNAKTSKSRLSLNPRSASTSATSSFQLPQHIEVSVLVTPPRVRDKRSSMERMTRISPTISAEKPPIPIANSSPLPQRSGLCRIGTRSLDNLCSPEHHIEQPLEPKTYLGSSTPTLNKEPLKSEAGVEDFWEFKVPQPPKPKMEVNRTDAWAESIEKLLADPCGLDVFTSFLQQEFSAENICFFTACQRFKQSFPELTQSQRISSASTIFQRFLQNGATDPVNVDFQARCQVEKALSQPTVEMFDLPLGQVYNLLKFDCYPRFLRSDLYRDIASGANPLPLSVGDPSDSDQDSVKSHKSLNTDSRRRSLLPWNIKSRSKNKNRGKNDLDGLNSDISFIQRAAMSQNLEGSDQDDSFRRKSYKLCRVVLPDNSTTVLPCKPGESLCTTVQRLLEKREFTYSAFEVVSVATGKPLDLNMETSEMTAREIKVEPRAFLGIELPLGWRVGVRANPSRKISEVLKPILSQHSLKLDAVQVYNAETDEIVDLKWPMGRVDGYNVHVKLIDPKLDEITNHIRDFGSYDNAFLDDDQASTKTSSSQASSSVFRGFLRRSSKKYKKKAKNCDPVGSQMHTAVDSKSYFAKPDTCTLQMGPSNCPAETENTKPSTPRVTSSTGVSAPVDSPLSLISSDLKLVETTRNRKPIYMTQPLESNPS